MAEEAAQDAGRMRRKAKAAGPLRVTLPAKVAYDPDALKQSIASVMERVGCPACFSGADCFFETERRVVVDAKGGLDPQPEPWSSDTLFARHQVSVAMAPAVKHDIDRVLEAVDKVIDIIGPHPCISGFDTFFFDEMIVVNPQMEAQQF